jgi:peptidylprolyl isomerase
MSSRVLAVCLALLAQPTRPYMLGGRASSLRLRPRPSVLSMTESGVADAAAAAAATFEAVEPAADDDAAAPSDDQWEVTDSGLKVYDEVVGDGDAPEKGDVVSVSYIGWLDSGAVFDDSQGQPFSFKLGAGTVIPGWDEGIATMKVGGTRNLVIKPELGYGEAGAGSTIPGNSTLNFECKLLGVEKASLVADAKAVATGLGFGANPLTFFTAIFLISFLIPDEILKSVGLK